MEASVALQADIGDIKKHLRIAYVLEHYGHEPVYQDDRHLAYISPFREDEHPSFDVFYHTIKGRTEPEERWGDRGEQGPNGRQGTQGDVLDLIERFEGCNRGRAIELARSYLRAQLEEDWEPPTITVARPTSPDIEDIAMLQSLARPLSASNTTWPTLVATRPGLADTSLPQDVVFLHPQHDTVVYLVKGLDGEVKGVRFRGSNGEKWQLDGSKNILLRLDEPDSDKDVLLCEGETDTWAAWTHLHEKFEVVGVPGVGNPPGNVGGEYFRDRTVYIAFDPDTAGSTAQMQWASYLQDRGCTTHIVVLPTGKDMASLRPEEIKNIESMARHLPPAPSGFVRKGDQFGLSSVSKSGDEVFHERSNWSFIPEAMMVGEGGERSYTGCLLPHKRAATLPASALTSVAKLRSWGSANQCRWFGNDSEVHKLAALMDHEAALLPQGQVTDQVGLFNGSFVWNGITLGSQSNQYVEGEASPGYGPHNIFIKEADVDAIEVFEALYNTQHPAVTGPVLAWLAAAPLRSTLREMPILSIMGLSGSGKTTLTELLTTVFSGTNISTNLTSTTPYGVETMMDTTNGFPLWLDEYRPGARDDAKKRLDQLLRDAYTGQESRKGGTADNLSRLRRIRTMAPIIVSGEDDFTETSHTDRMVLVRVSRSEQRSLAPLNDINTEGFAYAYLSSLLESDNVFDAPPAMTRPLLPPTDIDGLPSRQETNFRVLKYGWSLLESFLTSVDPTFAMPELDLSRCVAAGIEAASSSPVLELLQTLLDNPCGRPTVWVQDGELMVSSSGVLREAKNYDSIILPTTTAKGLTAILTSAEFGGESKRVYIEPHVSGYVRRSQMRVIALPLELLNCEEEVSDI